MGMVAAMRGYDAWLTHDAAAEAAEMRAEAFAEEMSWPPDDDGPVRCPDCDAVIPDGVKAHFCYETMKELRLR